MTVQKEKKNTVEKEERLNFQIKCSLRNYSGEFTSPAECKPMQKLSLQ